MKLKEVKSSIIVNVNHKTAWEVLSRYGDVSSFHSGVEKSYAEEGSVNKAYLGCERVCHVRDMGLKITLEERIIDYNEGKSYKYEVYRWKNFPIKKMFFEFEVSPIDNQNCEVHLSVEYKAKPGILTPFLTPKMKSLIRNVLLGYKHYMQTGEEKAPIKQLKDQYS